MNTADITNPVFRAAVKAIDAGNESELQRLLDQHPSLVSERLANGEQGYFKDPYLLYFVADNPIRTPRLPANIVGLTALLIGALKRAPVPSLQEQLDYTLGLVATGRIPRECGVKRELMDLLMDEGAKPDSGLGALAHGNDEAAARLIQRGGALTLATAVGLDRTEDVTCMAPAATQEERLVAITVAAFQGKPESIAFLLALGVGINDYPPPVGFHSHATPLHQAVCSGSLASVKLLVEAGADLALEDKIYHGTPLGWAGHLHAEAQDESTREQFKAIADFLTEQRAEPGTEEQ